jgi:hypothetical protein
MFYDAVANTHGLAADPTKLWWYRARSAGSRRPARTACQSRAFFNAVSEDLHFVIFACRRTLGSPRRAIVNGRIDVTRLKPIARLGYGDYAVIDKVFTIKRPTPTSEV